MITYKEIAAINYYGTEEDRKRLIASCGALGEYVDSAVRTLRGMAEGCGWKGRSLISFDGFDGSHLEYSADSVRYYSDGVLQGSIELVSDGTLRMSGPLWSQLRSMRAAVMDAVEACLSEENIRLAKSFTINGQVRVCMFTNPISGKMYCDSLDIEELREAVERDFPGVEVLSDREFENRYRSQRSIDKGRSLSDGAYVRPDFPLPVVYLFDGEGFSDLNRAGTEQEWEAYSDNVDRMVDLCRSVNHSLGVLAGLSGEDLNYDFHYGQAAYLFPGNTEDMFVLMTGFGREVLSSVAVRPDGFLLYEDMTGEPRRLSFSELESVVRDAVLSESNVRKARLDLVNGGYSVKVSAAESKSESEGKSKGTANKPS